MNLIIVGPCGVGKSTVAKSFAQRKKMVYLDFDEIRGAKMNKSKGLPCSVATLDLKECLSLTLNTLHTYFVLDIGGDTVFRSNVDNDERLKQVFWLKKSYSAQIVILTATHDILFQRFAISRNRNSSEFNGLWVDWLTIGEPYWRSCTDLQLDTSSLAVDEIGQRIEEILKY